MSMIHMSVEDPRTRGFLHAFQNPTKHDVSLYGSDGILVNSGSLWLYSSLIRSILESPTNPRDSAFIIPEYDSHELKEALKTLDRQGDGDILISKTTRNVLKILGVNLDLFLEPATSSTEKVVIVIDIEDTEETGDEDLNEIQEVVGSDDDGHNVQAQNQEDDLLHIEEEEQVDNHLDEIDELLIDVTSRDRLEHEEIEDASQQSEYRKEESTENGEQEELIIKKNATSDSVLEVTPMKKEVETKDNDCDLQRKKQKEVKDLIERVNGIWICRVCDYSSHKKTYLRYHAEKHVSGLRYQCKYCPKVCNTTYRLKEHKRKEHRNIIKKYKKYSKSKKKVIKDKTQSRITKSSVCHDFKRSDDSKSTQCPECEAVFTTKANMFRHYRSKHEGIKYPCTDCDYQATTLSILQRHTRTKHEGITKSIKCPECGDRFTSKYNMERHYSHFHTGLKYKCHQCDFQAAKKGNLKKHIKSKHDSLGIN